MSQRTASLTMGCVELGGAVVLVRVCKLFVMLFFIPPHGAVKLESKYSVVKIQGSFPLSETEPPEGPGGPG